MLHRLAAYRRLGRRTAAAGIGNYRTLHRFHLPRGRHSAISAIAIDRSDGRAVYAHLAAVYLSRAGAGPVIHTVYRYSLTGNRLNIATPRTADISRTATVVDIGIVDNRRVIDNIDRTAWRIIPGVIAGINIATRYKRPPGRRHIIAGAERNIDADAGTHRRPSVIAATLAPGYPCGSPCPSGYPDPAIHTALRPTSVVEGCPAPGIIRHPHITVIRHSPIAIGIIRPEARAHIGRPDISVLGIIEPLSVRRKIIIKFLVIAIIAITIAVVVIILSVHFRYTTSGHNHQNSKNKSRYPSACPVAEHFHSCVVLLNKL